MMAKMMELHKHGEVISNAGEVRSKTFTLLFYLSISLKGDTLKAQSDLNSRSTTKIQQSGSCLNNQSKKYSQYVTLCCHLNIVLKCPREALFNFLGYIQLCCMAAMGVVCPDLPSGKNVL